MAIVDLIRAEEVAAETDVAETNTPANGSTVRFLEFWGNAAHTPNAVVCVVWDYAGGGEEILWSTKGTVVNESVSFLADKTGDGTKKVALCLKNGTSGELILSGRLRIEVV